MDKTTPSVAAKDLPYKASIKYLGSQPTKGLWGMKHTRRPVDHLVHQAKNLPADHILPIVKIEVSLQGLSFVDVSNKKEKSKPVSFDIDSISYGVQDLVYTRVFSIIVVTGQDLSAMPFVCHSFVCESRNQARHITYALAAAFQEYLRLSKLEGGGSVKKKKFAIDLRTPEEQAQASDEETEA